MAKDRFWGMSGMARSISRISILLHSVIAGVARVSTNTSLAKTFIHELSTCDIHRQS